MYNKQGSITLLVGVIMLFLLPLEWIFSFMIAALIHELGHYCAVLLMGGSVNCVKIGITGAIMEASELTEREEAICLMSGPLAGLLTLFCLRTYPAVAICGLLQTIYNLLPIYPLDGGRLLRNLILSHGGTDKTFRTIERVSLALILLLCTYIRIRFGISLFLFFLILLFRKTPCKQFGDWI